MGYLHTFEDGTTMPLHEYHRQQGELNRSLQAAALAQSLTPGQQAQADYNRAKQASEQQARAERRQRLLDIRQAIYDNRVTFGQLGLTEAERRPNDKEFPWGYGAPEMYLKACANPFVELPFPYEREQQAYGIPNNCYLVIWKRRPENRAQARLIGLSNVPPDQ